MESTALLILIMFSSCTAVEKLADLPIPVRDMVLSFTEEERLCHQSGMVFYSGNCYNVGEQGPCEDDQWLVYDQKRAVKGDGTLKVVCQEKPCPANYTLMIPDYKCYHSEDINNGICSEKTFTTMNLFGSYFCSCSFHQATLKGSKDNNCHFLYTQGPCEEGTVFLPILDLVNFGVGQCLPSPCGSEGQVELLLANGKKKCFERFESQDSCPENQKLELVVTTSFPGIPQFSCVAMYDETTAIPITAEDMDCVENKSGECVKTVKQTQLEKQNWNVDFD